MLQVRTEDLVTAVAVDEDGQQQPWSRAKSMPVRILCAVTAEEESR